MKIISDPLHVLNSEYELTLTLTLGQEEDIGCHSADIIGTNISDPLHVLNSEYELTLTLTLGQEEDIGCHSADIIGTNIHLFLSQLNC